MKEIRGDLMGFADPCRLLRLQHVKIIVVLWNNK